MKKQKFILHQQSQPPKSALHQAQNKISILETIYSETERNIRIFGNQVIAMHFQEKDIKVVDSVTSIIRDVKRLLAELQPYRDTIKAFDLFDERDLKSNAFGNRLSRRIHDLKAVKFVPNTYHKNTNNLGYLEEYNINQLLKQSEIDFCNNTDSFDNFRSLSDEYRSPPMSPVNEKHIELQEINDEINEIQQAYKQQKSSHNTSVFFCPNGDLYTINGQRKRIQVFSYNKSKDNFTQNSNTENKLSDISSTSGAVVINDNLSHVYFAGTKLTACKLDSKEIYQGVSLDHHLSDPHCLTSLSNCQLAATHGNNIISLHDHEARTLKIIRDNGKFSHICRDIEDNLWVTDQMFDTVKVFDKLGQPYLGAVWEEKLCEPAGICVDKDGFILLADSGHDRICKFSKSGRFIQTLVSYKDGLYNPQGLAVYGDIIAVTSEDTVTIWRIPTREYSRGRLLFANTLL